jgi:excisionase family DNA binding protein
MSRNNGAAGQSRDLREVQELLGIPAGAPQQLLTLPEVCRILRLSPKTLQRRIETGELVVVRDGRRVLVTPRDLARYIGARRTL